MSDQAGGKSPAVVDTSLVLNFLRIDRGELLGRLPGFHLHIVNHVVAEVIQEPPRSRLVKAVEDGALTEIEITDLETMATYFELRRVLDDGEAATIAAAQHRGWIVAIDERGRALREVEHRIGTERLLNTPGLLVHAVQIGVLEVAEAEAIRTELANQRFVIRPTIQQLLDAPT